MDNVEHSVCVVKYFVDVLDNSADNADYHMTSDNVFSKWLTSLVTFFDNTLYNHLTRRNAR